MKVSKDLGFCLLSGVYSVLYKDPTFQLPNEPLPFSNTRKFWLEHTDIRIRVAPLVMGSFSISYQSIDSIDIFLKLDVNFKTFKNKLT